LGVDIELLRTFLELNRTRHFRRSAEALSVTQAAVSSRLKTLEERLGVTLFERSTRDMQLTPQGARLVRHSEKIIATWRAARQDVSLGEAEQQLVIGGSLRLWDVILQRWLHDLRRSHPSLAIIAEAQSPDVLTRRLIDGTLDVAIMLEPAQLDILQIVEVAKLELVLVSSTAGLQAEEAIETDYVYVDWGLSFALDHRRAFPDAAESVTRVSLAKMALEYINRVGGSAYLPRMMVATDIELGLLHEVESAPVFERNAYATFPVRSPRADLIEESLRLVRSG
jgi:DNA-binding transcriptional LysR family regulator